MRKVGDLKIDIWDTSGNLDLVPCTENEVVFVLNPVESIFFNSRNSPVV